MSDDCTFITNEDVNKTLSSRLDDCLKRTDYFDVLVGYFFTSGFYTMYKSLENVKKIRILIGISTDYKTFSLMEESKNTDLRIPTDKTKDLFSKRVIEELENSQDSIDIEEGILKFIEWLQCGKLEIKTYPYDRIHAKVYIMTFDENELDDGRVITGSSNFTSAGLNDNLEFNVELKNKSDYDFSLKKFDELWEQAVDVSEEYVETVKKDTWLNESITPYELYLKFLYEYLKDKINLDRVLIDRYIPPGFLDLQYQKDAVVDAKSKLDQYGGVFLSDVVGVGKTYISALLAQQLDGKTLIIAPPVLLDEGNPGSWPNVFNDFGVRSYKWRSWGMLDRVIEEGFDDYKNIFIDEAHLFRNARTQRYAKLAQICRGKRVILVTATPLNNTPLDILSQISLFQKPNNSTLPGPNVKNLNKYFNNKQNRLNRLDRQRDEEEYLKVVKKNSEDIRNDVLQHIMVRRTRKDIETIYSKDLEEQGLKFLDVNNPIPVYYEFDESINDLFMDTLELISKKLTYSRYMPLLYLEEEDPEMRAPQTNMGAFMRMLLVKRLESSFYAFKKSIGRFIKSYEHFINSIETSGYVYFSKKNIDKIFTYLEEGDEESVEELIKENKAEKKSIEKFKKDKLLDDLNHDLYILKEINYKWKDVESDPKLDKFRNILYNDENLKNKIIVFTESSETAEYLTRKLNTIFENKVLYFSGSSNNSIKQVITDNFDAKARVQKDDYRILITTDILAEGVNLHRSNVVINYDIPWNPTKLMQRVGRVQRIGSPFDEVFIYNFFPTEEINEDIGLEEAAKSKISAFIEMLGNDSKLLTDEEIKGHELFEKLNSKQSINGDEEEDIELKFLTLLREIRDNDSELFERIKNIPKKARSGKSSNKEGLFTFVRKGKFRKMYLNTNGKVDELTFGQTVELLICDEDTKRVPITEKFYDLLECNKKEFKKNFEKENFGAERRGRSIFNRVSDIVESFDHSRFTDNDDQFVIDLLNAIEEGIIPYDIAKKAYEKMNDSCETDSLILLNILKENIPSTFLYYYPVTGSADIMGKKEVVLSEYLKGD